MVSLVAAGCRTGADVVMWGPCAPENDPTGTDGTYSMVCRGGVWTPVMTVDEFVRINRGEADVVIAPLPERTEPTPTTTPPVSTTTAPTTTATTSTPVLAPTILRVSPNAGPPAGGSRVTIWGTNLAGTTAVTFGGTLATDVTVDSAASITATAPAHVAGAVDVAVTAPGGAATATGAFTYVEAPTFISVTPAVGSGGTRVTITGTNFAGDILVGFGSGLTVAATDITVISPTTLTATIPFAPPGPVDVVVATYSGSATAHSAFTYVN